MAPWLEIRSEHRGKGRLPATRELLRKLFFGVCVFGGGGALLYLLAALAFIEDPLTPGDWLDAALRGFAIGAGFSVFLGPPMLVVSLAADAGEAISQAVEDRRERLTRAGDPARGTLSEPEDTERGGLSALPEAHGLSEPLDANEASDPPGSRGP